MTAYANRAIIHNNRVKEEKVMSNHRLSRNESNRMRQIGAVGGIVFIVLQAIAQLGLQAGGAEPRFNAPTEPIVAFFASKSSQFMEVSTFLSGVSMIGFLWFLGALWATLREAEGEPAWLSLTAVLSGVIAAAVVFAPGGWHLALFRMGEGVDPQIARLLFDSGNLGFANMWFFLASLLLAYAAVTLQTGVLPRWTGWAGLAIAVALLVARAFWATSGVVITAYLLFELWLFAVSVALLRQAAKEPARTPVQRPVPPFESYKENR